MGIEACEEAKCTNTVYTHFWSTQLTLDLNSSQQDVHIYYTFMHFSLEQPINMGLYLFIQSSKALHYACMNDLFTRRVAGLILLFFRT